MVPRPVASSGHWHQAVCLRLSITTIVVAVIIMAAITIAIPTEHTAIPELCGYLSHHILRRALWVCLMTIPILQLGNLRLREVKQLI